MISPSSFLAFNAPAEIFETDAEARVFALLIREELEVRVGKAISEGITKEQLDEFLNAILRKPDSAGSMIIVPTTEALFRK